MTILKKFNFWPTTLFVNEVKSRDGLQTDGKPSILNRLVLNLTTQEVLFAGFTKITIFIHLQKYKDLKIKKKIASFLSGFKP